MADGDGHSGTDVCAALYSGNDCDKNLTDALVGYGCDPDAETVWGLSWRDMKAVR